MSKVCFKISSIQNSALVSVINSLKEISYAAFVSSPLALFDFYRSVFRMHSVNYKNIVLDVKLPPFEIAKLIKPIKTAYKYIAGLVVYYTNDEEIQQLATFLHKNNSDLNIYLYVPRDKKFSDFVNIAKKYNMFLYGCSDGFNDVLDVPVFLERGKFATCFNELEKYQKDEIENALRIPNLYLVYDVDNLTIDTVDDVSHSIFKIYAKHYNIANTAEEFEELFTFGNGWNDR